MSESSPVDLAGWETALQALVGEIFGQLRRTVQKNLAVLTVAYMRILSAGRSGAGQLSLAALARLLPTAGTAHARQKRLHRFLDNPRLDPRGVSDGLAKLIVGQRGEGLWPILFDQTKAGSTQALVAGVPFEGRALPLSVYTFDYPWQETVAKSQNELEEVFLCDVESALPTGVRAVWIGDRGYARAALLRRAAQRRWLYVLRGRVGTCIEWKGKRLKLGQLRCRQDRALRYRGVLYQAQEKVPVDVITFHGTGFEEPWYLLVPAGCEKELPTATVVKLYRQRMQVEQSFRDFKTHLGLRGLQLKTRVAPRIGRLLLAFTLAYALALALGANEVAQQARASLEIPRRASRHGTQRCLSVLSMAMLLLAHPVWRDRSHRALERLLESLRLGAAILRAPPKLPCLKAA